MFSRILYSYLICCTIFSQNVLAEEVKGGDIFSLKKGMSAQDIQRLGFGDVKKYPRGESGYFIPNPKMAMNGVPKNAKLAQLTITPKSGLLSCHFFWSIPTDIKGRTVRRVYTELRNIMIKKFGISPGSEIDRLQYGNILMQEPLLYYSWVISRENKWRLLAVTLEVDGTSRRRVGRLNVSGNSDEMAQIRVSYEFIGSNPFLEMRLGR